MSIYTRNRQKGRTRCMMGDQCVFISSIIFCSVEVAGMAQDTAALQSTSRAGLYGAGAYMPTATFSTSGERSTRGWCGTFSCAKSMPSCEISATPSSFTVAYASVRVACVLIAHLHLGCMSAFLHPCQGSLDAQQTWTHSAVITPASTRPFQDLLVD